MPIELVLPLKLGNEERGSDLDRMKRGLLRSLDLFADPNFVTKLNVIIPDDEISDLIGNIPRCSIPISILPESYYVPRGGVGDIPRRGWFIQQFIKLAFAKECSTEFYVTLDADVFLMSSFNETIIERGRAPAHYEPVSAHAGWWSTSAQVLEAKLSAQNFDPIRAFGVTPAFLKTDVTRSLMVYLNKISNKLGKGDWISYLCENTDMQNFCWTEYSLYWTYLINNADPSSIYYDKPIYFYTHYISEARQRLLHSVPAEDKLFGIIQSSYVSVSEFCDFMDEFVKFNSGSVE